MMVLGCFIGPRRIERLRCDMPARIEPEEGSFVCDGRFRFLRKAIEEDKKDIPKSYQQQNCGVFECQECDNHTIFIAPISRLFRGEIRYCPYCANQSKSKKLKQYFYKYGDYVDKNKRLRYIAEGGRDNSKQRLVVVQDVYDNVIFTTRLTHIISGRTTKSPESVQKDKTERIVNCHPDMTKIRKYKEGDVIGNESNILFLKELPSIREPSGHIRRYGYFKNLDTGVEFKSLLKSVIEGNTQGLNHSSQGEIKIEKILKELNISFIREHTFTDCINPQTGRLLRFDFYLPDYKCCIEYDGEQHFHPTSNSWNTEENFINIKKRDKLKEQYCISKKIKIVRIPYFDYKKLTAEYILSIIEER